MKDFEPSGAFVAKVMSGVRAFETSRRAAPAHAERLLSSPLVRYALTAGGALLALDNVFRVAFLLFSPGICR